MRCVIVDDEPLAQERLADYVGRLPELALVASFDNALDALSFARTQPVDLMLLDISLGGMSGMELVASGALSCLVVLTTAHPQFAAESYEHAVVDYLLKPISFSRFVQAVDRVRRELARYPAGVPTGIFVKTEGRLVRVALDDIVLVEGRDDYRCIYTKTKRIMTPYTFGRLEELLPRERFCRVHKSFLVSMDKVTAVARDRIEIASSYVPISDTYRDRFFAMVANTQTRSHS